MKDVYCPTHKHRWQGVKCCPQCQYPGVPFKRLRAFVAIQKILPNPTGYCGKEVTVDNFHIVLHAVLKTLKPMTKINLKTPR